MKLRENTVRKNSTKYVVEADEQLKSMQERNLETKIVV